MEANTELNFIAKYNQTVHMLHELGVPVHLMGYRQLRIAIPYFAQNDSMSLAKELYPYIAKRYGEDPRAVEKAIRAAILQGWMRGDRSIWNKYFPGSDKVPSNKQFIAALAEYLY